MCTIWKRSFHFSLFADAPQKASIDGTSKLKLGLTLQLECITEAYPVANNYSWYFKPEHEQQFLCLSNTDKVYRIEKVAVHNAGLYKCSAENAIGFGTNSTELNVLVSCKYSLFVFYFFVIFISKPCKISCLT